MWRRYLSHPWCIPLTALLGVLLTLPTLGLGLFADDFIHRSLLVGEIRAPHAGSLFGLFNFMDGQPDHIQAMKVSGRLLWWAADSIRLSFWRPLSELTHWVDYRLWPDLPVLMHAQNLFWYGLLILLAGRLYRLLDNDPVRANLATLLFAVSSLHMQVVGWLAARNQLIAGCFMVLTLMAFHRWRREGSTRHAWLAAGTFVLGMMSAEAAIATMAYLVAYVVFMAPADETWHARLRALLPFLLILAVWRVSYTHMGFGSTGSGAYIDPGVSLPRFAQALMVRLPTLLLADLVRIPSSVVNGMAHAGQLQYAAMAAVVIALFVALGQWFQLWRQPAARFYAAGAVIALVPVCAAEPGDRLLLNAEIGMSGVIAMLISLAFARPSQGWLARLTLLPIWLMVGLYLVFSPLQTLAYSLLMEQFLTPTMLVEPLSLPAAAPGDPEHVILLNPPKPAMLFYYPFVRQQFGVNNPASTQALAVGNQNITLRTVDDSTLELSGKRGFMDSMSRDVATRPFKAGDVIDVGQMKVTVLTVSAEGVPLSARFKFSSPLSDPRRHFYAWHDEGYRNFALPAPGQQVVLPGFDARQMLLSRLRPPPSAGRLIPVAQANRFYKNPPAQHP